MASKDYDFLREAFKTAKHLSQDKNTQTGAIIVDSSGKIISRGANRMHFGFPQRYEGFPNEKRILLGRPQKYQGLTHAERDAIFYANRQGISLEGCTIYTTWTPCFNCAEVIINNGLTRFVTHQSTTDWYAEACKDDKRRINWEESIHEAIKLLKKGGVQYQCLTARIGDISILFNDQIKIP